MGKRLKFAKLCGAGSGGGALASALRYLRRDTRVVIPEEFERERQASLDCMTCHF